MRKAWKLVLLVTFLGVFLTPLKAHADVNDFTVTNFVGDYTLTNQDPQGELHIVENINVIFSDYNHGILRAIPDSYKHHSLQLHVNHISSTSGAPTGYTTYGSNGNTVLKIGNKSRTITGAQNYTIDYTLHNVISFYNDHDELYWDINGDQWQQPFEQVSAIFHIPAAAKPDTKQPVCYTGTFGSTEQNCTVSAGGETISFNTTKPLTANQTLTTAMGFGKGYFHPSKWYETVGEHTKQIVGLLAMPILLGGWAFRRWRKFGRDAKGRGVIVPQYGPPDGLIPLEAGALMHFSPDSKGITATIIDLAIRGYYKIIETKKEKLLGKDKLEYSFELQSADISALTDIEGQLLEAMFPDMNVGTAVAMADLKKSKLYTTVAAIQKKVTKNLVEQGYYRANPLTAGASMWVVVVILFFCLFIFGSLLGSAFVVGTIIALIITAGFAFAMPARTPKGVETKEYIEGLKLYLNVAEKDRIKMLQSPDAKYAANARAPKKTVELFERLLPYAIVLDVEKEWAKQFEDIYKQPPNWYSGNWTTFNAIMLTNSLTSNMQPALAGSFTAPSSSSSSGFSGGGFSGGGGGGGGGGGW